MSRPRRPRQRYAIRAGELLDTLLAGWGLDERLHQYRALVVWDEVVGPQIAARARPERIRDGVLEVCVDQPVWMQQLQLLKPQILARLNERLGDSPLREIYLRRGKVAAPAAKTGGAPAPAWRKMTLSPEEEAELGNLLSGVADEGLRRGLESLLVKQVKLSKSKDKKQLAADQIL